MHCYLGSTFWTKYSKQTTAHRAIFSIVCLLCFPCTCKVLADALMLAWVIDYPVQAVFRQLAACKCYCNTDIWALPYMYAIMPMLHIQFKWCCQGGSAAWNKFSMMTCRWQKCNYGSHHCGAGRESYHYQQKHFTATVYQDWKQVRDTCIYIYIYSTYSMIYYICCVYMYYTPCSSAEIKLTLSNAGQESYQSDKYGRHIVILRKLQRDGSSYKIMSDKGVMLTVLIGQNSLHIE